MSLQLYNTLTGRKEAFVPLEPGRVRMYSCGPTTYNFFHIGNARSFVFPDLLKRFLRFKGFDVLHVQNLTDVDDKIIQRAQELGVSFRRVAERYGEAYFEDLMRLGCQPPDVNPRASHHISQIIEIIQKLIERGYAYRANGDVYYRVDRFDGYGKLSRQTLSDLVAGARVEVGDKKEHPADFALWKAAKDGEPAWDSPWGPGRPGWHIECSAMSMTYLGSTFDIHTGGADLVFPHHENEIAQSEAATGEPFVRYWLHVGYINIDGEKMSKSRHNFILVREMFKTVAPEAVRLFLISKHYRSPIDFSEEELEATARGWRRLLGVKARLDRVFEGADVDPLPSRERVAMALWESDRDDKGLPQPQALAAGASRELWQETANAWRRFGQAMDDDLNSALAVGALFDLSRAINRYLDGAGADAGGEAARTAAADEAFQVADGVFHRLSDVLGLNVAAGQGASHVTDERVKALEGVVDSILQLRDEARRNKNWELADQLRDRLAAHGIQVEDGPAGSRWTWK